MSNEFINEILKLVLSSGILTFITTLFTYRITKSKTKADIEKVYSDMILSQAEGFLKVNTELFQLQSRYSVLFEEWQKTKETNTKLRAEFDRIHAELELLRMELQTERGNNLVLVQRLERVSRKTDKLPLPPDRKKEAP